MTTISVSPWGGRVLKTGSVDGSTLGAAYHLGEGRVLKTQ